MISNQKPYLTITKNILNAILLIIPVFIIVIIITSVLFLGIFNLGKYEVLLVPFSFFLSIFLILYFNRYHILRFRFFDDYIHVDYLTMPNKTVHLYYHDIASIEWKVSYTFRDSQSEYMLILHLKNESLYKGPTPMSLGLKYMSRENWSGVRPEYCPVLDAYDIAALKKHLSQQLPFHLNSINAVDLKKIERL